LDTLNYFTEEETESDTEPEQFSFLEGICANCLDTGFKHTIKDGVLGILYTTFTQNADGIPQKKLMVCNH
jgi:hypothetical protein